MNGADSRLREAYRGVADWLDENPREVLQAKSRDAEMIFRRLGITFAVYGTAEAQERLIPFDVIPRILAKTEWDGLQRGIVQRVKALNAFIADCYGAQEAVRAGVIPAALVNLNDAFVPEMVGHVPPREIYSHIVGTDIVRTGENEFFVLEDNCRTPSGVSYVLENRETMMHLFPELFATHRVAPVEDYPDLLHETLRKVAPPQAGDEPTVVVLTPGIHNSAYFEHAFLADQMGVELVEGSDLFVDDGYLWMRTTRAPQRVDVVYRRIDDDFLDPLTFRPDSALGVPGIFDVYRAGRVTITNAPGAGIADDKAVYTYLPDLVRFFTGEEPILRNIETYRCAEEDALSYTLENLDKLVVKEVHGSGGYGMLVGPTSTREEREAFARKLKAKPDGYISQPTLALSACPTLVDAGVAPRHVDFRPFALASDEVRVVPGGLTRVAMTEGSLVVNSSQGGGTKDTWVLEA